MEKACQKPLQNAKYLNIFMFCLPKLSLSFLRFTLKSQGKIYPLSSRVFYDLNIENSPGLRYE